MTSQRRQRPIRLTDEVWAQVQETAHDRRMSASAWVERAITGALPFPVQDDVLTKAQLDAETSDPKLRADRMALIEDLRSRSESVASKRCPPHDYAPPINGGLRFCKLCGERKP